MDRTKLIHKSEFEWVIEPTDAMRVPAVIYAMPDAHWGYGFPIGEVAAFDADAGGVISGGGARWAVEQGWGEARQQKEMGTLGSDNHYLEVHDVRLWMVSRHH